MPTLPLNGALSLLTNALGIRLDPFHGFNFLVEIEGLLVGGFSECSGLQVESETQDYREGGLNEYTHKFVGGVKYPNLILKHGMTPLDGLWSWHQDIAQGKVSRKNGTVYLLNKEHIPVTWWDFKEAIPIKWSGSDLRADSSTVVIESVELSHHGLSRPPGAVAAALSLAASVSIGGSLF
jgi:phage tail-like protein